jgi:hypothetical protein
MCMCPFEHVFETADGGGLFYVKTLTILYGCVIDIWCNGCFHNY